VKVSWRDGERCVFCGRDEGGPGGPAGAVCVSRGAMQTTFPRRRPPRPRRSYMCVSRDAMQSRDQGPYLEQCSRCAWPLSAAQPAQPQMRRNARGEQPVNPNGVFGPRLENRAGIQNTQRSALAPGRVSRHNSVNMLVVEASAGGLSDRMVPAPRRVCRTG
jgi:hypothetical protein